MSADAEWPYRRVLQHIPVISESSVRRSQLYRDRDRHGSRPPTQALLTTTTIPKMMVATVLIALLSLLLLMDEATSITPEDVRFATARCQNDSTADPAMRLQWSMRMFPDSHETHCYVKCLLSKLGLINLKYRGLDGNKFIQPLENRNIDISEECYSLLEDVLSGTCKAYYTKWMELRKTCVQFFYISLFEDPHEADKFARKNSKRLGETASEFCSRSAHVPESKELTSDQISGDDILTIFKCELECIFRHIRYFDAYGRLDESEMRRSFREAMAETAANIEALSKCAHRSNALYSSGPCQMAYELYRCLLKKLTNFREIYTQRDKISRYY